MRLPWVVAMATMLAAPALAQSGKDAGRGTGAQGARWRTADVPLVLDPSMDGLGVRSIQSLVDAVSAWQVAGEYLPTITVQRGVADDLGYRPGESNQNIIRFDAKGSERAQGALAITVLTFDLERGVILDADIVINGDYDFEAFEDGVAAHETSSYDLQNVLTHEVGHLLGLGEDYEHEDATMYAYSLPGETGKRELSNPDADSVNRLYPDPPVEDEAVVATTCGVTLVAGARSKAAGRGAWLAMGGLLLVGGYWMRRSRRAAAWVAAGMLLCPQAFSGLEQAALDAPEWATVSALRPHWEQGLIVTDLELRSDSGRILRSSTLGGRIGWYEQWVSHLTPVSVGSRIQVRVVETDRTKVTK